MEAISGRKLSPSSVKGFISSGSMSFTQDQEDVILPGLPNHLSQMCLIELPPSTLFFVSRAWRQLLYSPSFPPFFSLYVLLSTGTVVYRSVDFFSLDPPSLSWRRLPPPPACDPPLKLLHKHPSFMSRNLSIQSVSVLNQLVVVAGTTDHFMPALSKPLVFHPETAQWSFGPQFTTPRRWCVVGTVGSTVFLGSGIGARYSSSVARSMEKWNLAGKSQYWEWESLKAIEDGKFSREAVDAVACKGMMCMVNINGSTVKEGAMYNPARDAWGKMPIGMLAGWNGPAAAMNEETIYVVDEARGILSKYDDDRDCWDDIVEHQDFKQSAQIAAGRGKVCVVAGSREKVIVVDVVSRPPGVWTVNLPLGHQVLSAHILPRMCK